MTCWCLNKIKRLICSVHEDFIYKGRVTCGADEGEADGAPGDVNSEVCYGLIDKKLEIICLSRAPGCLQEGHLGDHV